MINIDLTILKTINKIYDKARFLGQLNPEIFRAILEVCTIQEILEWSIGMDYVTEEVRELLKDKMTDLILHRCGFEIVYSTDDTYMSTNIPMPENNDFWKRVKLDPVVPITAKAPSRSTVVVPNWVRDPDYQPVLVLYSDDNNNPPTIDINNASVHDKMNVYLNEKNGSAWFYGTDCQWHSLAGGNATFALTDSLKQQIKSLITTDVGIKYDQASSISSKLEEGGNGTIGVVTTSEIQNML